MQATTHTSTCLVIVSNQRCGSNLLASIRPTKMKKAPLCTDTCLINVSSQRFIQRPCRRLLCQPKRIGSHQQAAQLCRPPPCWLQKHSAGPPQNRWIAGKPASSIKAWGERHGALQPDPG